MSRGIEALHAAVRRLEARGDIRVVRQKILPPPPAEALAGMDLPAEMRALYEETGGIEIEWQFADRPGSAACGRICIPPFNQWTRFNPPEEWHPPVLQGREHVVLDDHQDGGTAYVLRSPEKPGTIAVAFSAGRYEGDTVVFESIEDYLVRAAEASFGWYWQVPERPTNREAKRNLARLREPGRKLAPIVVGSRAAHRVNHDLLRGVVTSLATLPTPHHNHGADFARVHFDLGMTRWVARGGLAPVRSDVYEALRAEEGWTTLASKSSEEIIRALTHVAPPRDHYFSGEFTPFAQRLGGLLTALEVARAVDAVLSVGIRIDNDATLTVIDDGTSYEDSDFPIEGSVEVTGRAMTARLVETLLHRLLAELASDRATFPPSSLLTDSVRAELDAWLNASGAHHAEHLASTLTATSPEELQLSQDASYYGEWSFPKEPELIAELDGDTRGGAGRS